jgi:ATP synthase protein I
MADIEEERKKRAEELLRQVRARELRKERAAQDKRRSLMFGLGMIGMVGWSVAIPTLIGIAVGMWLDRTWPGPHSWTLSLLFIGVILGCLNAWYWVKTSLGRLKNGGRTNP